MNMFYFLFNSLSPYQTFKMKNVNLLFPLFFFFFYHPPHIFFSISFLYSQSYDLSNIIVFYSPILHKRDLNFSQQMNIRPWAPLAERLCVDLVLYSLFVGKRKGKVKKSQPTQIWPTAVRNMSNQLRSF